MASSAWGAGMPAAAVTRAAAIAFPLDHCLLPGPVAPVLHGGTSKSHIRSLQHAQAHRIAAAEGALAVAQRAVRLLPRRKPHHRLFRLLLLFRAAAVPPLDAHLRGGRASQTCCRQMQGRGPAAGMGMQEAPAGGPMHPQMQSVAFHSLGRPHMRQQLSPHQSVKTTAHTHQLARLLVPQKGDGPRMQVVAAEQAQHVLCNKEGGKRTQVVNERKRAQAALSTSYRLVMQNILPQDCHPPPDSAFSDLR